MNQRPFCSGSHQQSYVNSYANKTYYQQTTQTTSNHFSTQQYPGTVQYTAQQYTVSNQYSTQQHPGVQYCGQQHPGPEQFNAQQYAGRSQYPAQLPGALYSEQQYPGPGQYTEQQFSGNNQYSAQHPGAQYPEQQYPGTQYFAHQYPGVSQYQSVGSGYFQPPQSQYPGASTQYPGTWQFAENSQYTDEGISRCTGLSARCAGLSKSPGNAPKTENSQVAAEEQNQETSQCVESSPLTSQQTSTQDNGTQCHSENGDTSQAPKFNFATTFNSEEVFGSLSGSSGPNQNNTEVYQFAGPSGNHKELLQTNVARKQKRRTSATQWTGKTGNTKENNSVDEEEERQEQQEKMANLIRLQHFRDSYMKIRTLIIVCQDFKTPVFGNFPGNKGEMTLVSNLVHFLNNELKMMKFVSGEENTKVVPGEGNDPMFKAKIPDIKNAIERLGLEKMRKELQMAKDQLDSKSDEVDNAGYRRREQEVKISDSVVVAHKSRMKALGDRKEKEKKNYATRQLQFKEEIENINTIEVPGLQEKIRKLQQGIADQTKFYCNLRENVRKQRTRNATLRQHVSEVETKNTNMRKDLLILSTVPNNGREEAEHLRTAANFGNFPSAADGHFVM